MNYMEIIAILLLMPVIVGLWIMVYVFWIEMRARVKRLNDE